MGLFCEYPAELPFFTGTSIMAKEMCDKRELSYAFLANLRVPMFLRHKLRLVLGNTWTKVRGLRGCCGNYGQPGC
jgi:hypothetical protein